MALWGLLPLSHQRPSEDAPTHDRDKDSPVHHWMTRISGPLDCEARHSGSTFHSWTSTKLLRRSTSISYWHQPVRISNWLSPTLSVSVGITSVTLLASCFVNLRKSI